MARSDTRAAPLRKFINQDPATLLFFCNYNMRLLSGASESRKGKRSLNRGRVLGRIDPSPNRMNNRNKRHKKLSRARRRKGVIALNFLSGDRQQFSFREIGRVPSTAPPLARDHELQKQFITSVPSPFPPDFFRPFQARWLPI